MRLNENLSFKLKSKPKSYEVDTSGLILVFALLAPQQKKVV
jgi:hypothetical protein